VPVVRLVEVRLMGCTDCSRSGGCGTRKGEEKELLAELLGTIYPSRRWGAPDDAARWRRGLPERDARRLQRAASATLRAPTFFRTGQDDESCDYIYVLCVGRQPSLLELREAQTLQMPEGDAIRERYLRVALSAMGRVAAVQEVAFNLDLEGDLYVLREQPRDGIYDPILLERTRRLVALLVEWELTYLDFGLLMKPPSVYLPGFHEGDYGERYEQQPVRTVNCLFYPQPPTMIDTSFIPARAA
jgi:hypothetical protein